MPGMSYDPLPGRPNLPEAIKIAYELGVKIEPARRTGELKFSHHSWSKSLKINRRERTAPGLLVTRLSQMLRARTQCA